MVIYDIQQRRSDFIHRERMRLEKELTLCRFNIIYSEGMTSLHRVEKLQRNQDELLQLFHQFNALLIEDMTESVFY